MKTWLTEIRAIDPTDGEMKTWAGPRVPAITWGFAEQYCQNNGLGYCKVVGEFVCEIPCNPEDPCDKIGDSTDYDSGQN